MHHTSCAMWLNISRQDTLIWFPGVHRQTFQEWVGRFNKIQVCQLFDQLGTLAKKHSFPPITNFYMYKYVGVLCPSELSKCSPAIEKTQVGMSTTQPPVQTFATLPAVSKWPADNLEDPLNKTSNQCYLYQQHKLIHKACNQHNLWLQWMLKRPMENGKKKMLQWWKQYLQFKPLQNLGTPTFSTKKKTRHRQTGLNHREWKKKLVVKVLSMYHKRP